MDTCTDKMHKMMYLVDKSVCHNSYVVNDALKFWVVVMNNTILWEKKKKETYIFLCMLHGVYVSAVCVLVFGKTDKYSTFLLCFLFFMK